MKEQAGRREITLDEAFHGTRKSLALEMDEPCATCQGSGNVGGKPCASCHGTGWQRARRDVDVRIPAGVRTGQKVRVSGEGGGGADGRGDLYLGVSVAPNPQFERKGDDIHVTLPITAPEAALGGPIAMIEDGDEIVIDVDAKRLDLNVAAAQLEQRCLRRDGHGLALRPELELNRKRGRLRDL